MEDLLDWGDYLLLDVDEVLFIGPWIDKLYLFSLFFDDFSWCLKHEQKKQYFFIF